MKKLLFVIIGGFVLTLTSQVYEKPYPVGPMNIPVLGGCVNNHGFPFQFTGSCTTPVTAFVADWIFWSFFLFLIVIFVGVLKKAKKN